MAEFQLPVGCSPELRAQLSALAQAATQDGNARAALDLGNALYQAEAREPAIAWWEKAAKIDRDNPAVWRHLGIGYFNVFRDLEAAKGAFLKAFRLGLPPGNAQVLYERDQLWKRTRERPDARLAELDIYPQLVSQLDSLTLEYAALLNQTGHHRKALELLRSRRFVPWPGEPGLILAQWTRSNIAIGREALWRSAGSGGDPAAALAHFQAVLVPPENLGETWPSLSNHSEPHYWAALAARATGAADTAQQHLSAAAAGTTPPFSNASYWAALTLRELGRPQEARRLFEKLLAFSQTLKTAPAPTPRPITSLTATPPFDDDPQARQTEQALLLEALARHGLNGEDGADRKTARRLLTDILRDNPSHQLAADLLIALDWTP
jgi:tetratricopeptide (TPR) repeat protein